MKSRKSLKQVQLGSKKLRFLTGGQQHLKYGRNEMEKPKKTITNACHVNKGNCMHVQR